MNTEDLKKLLAEATPGPWTHASDKLAAGNIKAPDNAALIVAAVNALPELLAENVRLAGLIRVLLENEPHDAVSDGGHTVLDLWRHDARAALKETGQ